MSGTVSKNAAPPRQRRRKLGRHLAAAVALPAIAAGFLVARDGLAAPGVAPSAARAPVAQRMLEDPVTGQFSRFALNVLLVPLIDDDEPPRWTDVAMHHFCGPATRVEVNGQPLEPGASVPATAFTVRWHIDQCWPLDRDALELSGDVELQVFHEDDGLDAVVDARQLRVSTPKGSRSVGTPFPASMSLARAAAPSSPTPVP
jgi:hypothetical protein